MGLELTSGTLIFVVCNYSVFVFFKSDPLPKCRPVALKYYMPRLAMTHYCGCVTVVSQT